MSDVLTLADVGDFTDNEIRHHLTNNGYPTNTSSLRLLFIYALADLGLLENEDARFAVTETFRSALLLSENDFMEKFGIDPAESKRLTRTEWIYVVCGRCPVSLFKRLKDRGSTYSYEDIMDFYGTDSRLNSHPYFAARFGSLTGDYFFTGTTSTYQRHPTVLPGQGLRHSPRTAVWQMGTIFKRIEGDYSNRDIQDIVADEIRLTNKASKIYPFVQEIVGFDPTTDIMTVEVVPRVFTVQERISMLINKDLPIDRAIDLYDTLSEKAKEINNRLIANKIYHYGFKPEHTFVDEGNNLWLTEFNAASDIEIVALSGTFHDNWKSIDPVPSR